MFSLFLLSRVSPKEPPPFGTRLFEAKYSVLYTCRQGHLKQQENMALFGTKKPETKDWFHQQTGHVYESPIPRPTLRLVTMCPAKLLVHTPRKVAGQRATVKAKMNGLSPDITLLLYPGWLCYPPINGNNAAFFSKEKQTLKWEQCLEFKRLYYLPSSEYHLTIIHFL